MSKLSVDVLQVLRGGETIYRSGKLFKVSDCTQLKELQGLVFSLQTDDSALEQLLDHQQAVGIPEGADGED